jgi:hypothetical protein
LKGYLGTDPNSGGQLVGIEKYDQPGWDVSGPCANAIAVAQWLLTVGTPAANIHAFFEAGEGLQDEITGLQRRGVRVARANWETIDTFCRVGLPADRPMNSRLLVYWSGHGCTDKAGSRIFFCRDYTEKLRSRVFNGSNFLRTLRAPDYRRFSEQIFLADVCGVYSQLPVLDRSDVPDRLYPTHQLAYFATPEGKYATGPNGRGVFTDTVLKVLERFHTWPDQQDFAKRVEDALKQIGATWFRFSGFTDNAEVPEILVGSMGEHGGNAYFRSAIELLSDLDKECRVSSALLPYCR